MNLDSFKTHEFSGLKYIYGGNDDDPIERPKIKKPGAGHSDDD